MLALLALTGCNSLGNRIDKGIEKVGTELTGVPVTVESVSLRIGPGKGEISGLTIGNLEGYSDLNAFELEYASLNLGLFSLVGSSRYVVDELIITSPVVRYEQIGPGQSNLKELLDRVQSSRDSHDEPATGHDGVDGEADESESRPVRIRVKSLVIEGVTFDLLLADGTARTIVLPSLQMSDVGGKEGITPLALGALIVGSIGREVLKQALEQRLMAGGRLDGGLLAAYLQEHFELSEAQLESVRETALLIGNEVGRIVDQWADQGYTDPAAIREQLETVAANALEILSDALDQQQLESIRALLTNLQEIARDTANRLTIDRVIDSLGLEAAQLPEFRDLYRQFLENLSLLVHRYRSDPAFSLDEMLLETDRLQKELNLRLGEFLSPDQLDRFRTLFGKIRARIEKMTR